MPPRKRGCGRRSPTPKAISKEIAFNMAKQAFNFVIDNGRQTQSRRKKVKLSLENDLKSSFLECCREEQEGSVDSAAPNELLKTIMNLSGNGDEDCCCQSTSFDSSANDEVARAESMQGEDGDCAECIRMFKSNSSKAVELNDSKMDETQKYLSDDTLYVNDVRFLSPAGRWPTEVNHEKNNGWHDKTMAKEKRCYRSLSYGNKAGGRDKTIEFSIPGGKATCIRASMDRPDAGTNWKDEFDDGCGRVIAHLNIPQIMRNPVSRISHSTLRGASSSLVNSTKKCRPTSLNTKDIATASLNHLLNKCWERAVNNASCSLHVPVSEPPLLRPPIQSMNGKNECSRSAKKTTPHESKSENDEECETSDPIDVSSCYCDSLGIDYTNFERRCEKRNLMHTNGCLSGQTNKGGGSALNSTILTSEDNFDALRKQPIFEANSFEEDNGAKNISCCVAGQQQKEEKRDSNFKFKCSSCQREDFLAYHEVSNHFLTHSVDADVQSHGCCWKVIRKQLSELFRSVLLKEASTLVDRLVNQVISKCEFSASAVAEPLSWVDVIVAATNGTNQSDLVHKTTHTVNRRAVNRLIAHYPHLTTNA